MLPPRPIGKRQVDLNEAGQNITNAQNHRPNSRVPIHDEESGKIIYVSPDDPRLEKDAADRAQREPVF